MFLKWSKLARKKKNQIGLGKSQFEKVTIQFAFQGEKLTSKLFPKLPPQLVHTNLLVNVDIHIYISNGSEKGEKLEISRNTYSKNRLINSSTIHNHPPFPFKSRNAFFLSFFPFFPPSCRFPSTIQRNPREH